MNAGARHQAAANENVSSAKFKASMNESERLGVGLPHQGAYKEFLQGGGDKIFKVTCM